MTLNDTRITAAGVMRCCLQDVAMEYDDGRKLHYGDKSVCPHCKITFTLVVGEKHPLWKPDWQIEQDAKATPGPPKP